jgi:hypothetical protein
MDNETAKDLIDRLEAPHNRSAAEPVENAVCGPKTPASKQTGTKQSSTTSHGSPVSRKSTASSEAPTN